MKSFKQSVVLIFILLSFLVSCSEDAKDIDPIIPKPEVEKPTPIAKDLKLSLTIIAKINAVAKNDISKPIFADSVSAVALIRRSGLDEVKYFPITLVRSSADSQQVELKNYPITMEGIKPKADEKWELKLFVGGEWNDAKKQLIFTMPENYAATEKQPSVIVNQPYVSAWQTIPTDEKGVFISADNQSTSLSLSLISKGVVIAHHIGSCDAETAVQINKIRIATKDFTFGGYYDLSDAKVLKELTDEQDLAWNELAVATDNKQETVSNTYSIDLVAPIITKVGKEIGENTYLYLWAMPSNTKEKQITVYADGQTKDKKQKFENLKIYEKTISLKENKFIDIQSSVVVKRPPKPIILKTVSAKKEIYADGKEFVSFIIEQGGVDVTKQCTIWKKGTSSDEKVVGGKFTTTTPGEYVFYAKKGELRSAEITVLAKKVPEKPIILKTVSAKKEIYADGKEVVSFIIEQGGVDVTKQCTIWKKGVSSDEKVVGGKFTTTIPGEYVFYAKKGELRSAEITVLAKKVPEKPIILKTVSAKKEIYADGKEFVDFIVEQGGVDVTKQCTIWKKGASSDEKVVGGKFTTTTPGEYVFYAKKGELRSAEITVLAKKVPEKPIILKTVSAKKEIYADGKEFVSFIVEQGGVNVTKQCTIWKKGASSDEKVVDGKFTTTIPGEYVFYAKKGELRSAEITVLAKKVPEKPIILKTVSAKKEIYADGKEVVSFIIEQGGVDVTKQCTIWKKGVSSDEKVVGGKFTTTIPGEYVFYAKKGELRSAEITVLAKKVPEKPIILKTVSAKKEIYADGKEFVDFIVEQGGVDVTKQCTIWKKGTSSDEKVVGGKFTTTIPGEYVFYAKKGELRSAEITVLAKKKEEGPIVLSTRSGKMKISADGKDYVEFVVKQSGIDVTDECRISRQQGIFEYDVTDKKFKTTRAGDYIFFAEKGGKRSDRITIKAIKENEIGNDGDILNGTLFCKNVTMNSGWYDVNKVGNGTINNDGLLCWAAASSNMLQWWLEDFKRKGHSLPESVPFGQGKRYRLAIFDEFYDTWLNYMHSTDLAILWFMKGGGDRYGASNGSHPTKKGYVAEGGYFRGVLPAAEEKKLFDSEFVHPYGAYFGWEIKNEDSEKGETIHERFSNLLTRLLKEGITTLSIDSHELTAWGCEVKDGLVVKVYITNSDDGADGLVSYNVLESGGRMHLEGYPGKTRFPTQIIRLTGLTAYSEK